jgi:hypothetical protein
MLRSHLQRELLCHNCGTPLFLTRVGTPFYLWQCPKECAPALHTGVPITEQLDDLQHDPSSTLEFNASHFFPPMTVSRISTAKVFMAQILYHFIKCTWGGCYNALYTNVLIPHLDAPDILDYVLRSSVIRDGPGVQVGKSGARLYPELRSRLQTVISPRIRSYLSENFQPAAF